MQSDSAAEPVTLTKVPAGHMVGALAPAGQYEPAGQSLHAVDPGDDWYVPAVQSEQLLCPLVDAIDPGLHEVAAVARAKQ